MYRKGESTLNPGCQPKFTVRPASPDEAGLFYASTPEQDMTQSESEVMIMGGIT